MDMAVSLVTSFTSGLFIKFHLDRNIRKLFELQKGVEREVVKQYAIREAMFNKEGNKEAEKEDIISIILRHNEKMRKSGQKEMTAKEICGNIELFYSAASDTSF